LKIVIVTR